MFTQNGVSIDSFDCSTGASGTCFIDPVVAFPKKSGKNTFFTVNSVPRGSSTYDSNANHDPDGDSNGTTIELIEWYRPANAGPVAPANSFRVGRIG